MTRPAYPREAPEGLRWVPGLAPAGRAYPARAGRCTNRQEVGRWVNMCGAAAVVVLEGGIGRCPNHSGGLWVEKGIVMGWTLEVEPDGNAPDPHGEGPTLPEDAATRKHTTSSQEHT